MTRDEVLAGRIGVSVTDAKAVYDALSILAINPPDAGSDQEEKMRYIESSLSNIMFNAKSLQRYVK